MYTVICEPYKSVDLNVLDLGLHTDTRLLLWKSSIYEPEGGWFDSPHSIVGQSYMCSCTTTVFPGGSIKWFKLN